MQIALFITCVNDTLFPEAGRATVRVLERLGHRVEFPEQQTCCGQMHANSGYADEALPLVTRFVRTFSPDRFDAVVARRDRAWRWSATTTPRLARRVRRRRARSRPSTALAPRVFELSEFLARRARRRRRRRLLPAPRRLSPELPLAADAACRRRAAASCCDTCAGSTWCELPEARVVLRLRRHLRGQERRHLGRDARRQDPLGPRHWRRGLHRARQLLPDAHRRWAVAPARPACARSISPRSCATGDDVREGDRVNGLPRGGPRTRCADAQLRHNLRHATHYDPRQARRAPSPSSTDWEQLREAGRADQDAGDAAPRHPSRDARAQCHRRGRRGPLGAPTLPRPTASSPSSCRPPARREVVKVKSIATDEIGLNAALEADGIAAHETDLAELIIQLARRHPSHILVPAIHRNRAEIRDLFRARAARHRGADRRPGGAAPRPLGGYLREKFLSRRRSRSAAPTSRSPRPAPCACSSPRATAACARRCRGR